MTMRFIGDIHGKFLPYINLLDGVADSVQVGDYGIGFPGVAFQAGFLDKLVGQMPGRHRFIRGNHDNPAEAPKSYNFIADGTVEEFAPGRHMMFIGGASSIDAKYRKEGIDWWPDEQAPANVLEDLAVTFEQVKPEVVVTHELPHRVAKGMFNAQSWEWSQTRFYLEQMFNAHKPKLWVFGHWHILRREDIEGTHFICLPELGAIDVDLEKL